MMVAVLDHEGGPKPLNPGNVDTQSLSPLADARLHASIG